MSKDKIVHIYDRIFKRIMGLSSSSVVNLINGIYNTSYDPSKSKVRYLATEGVSEGLDTTFSDIIIIINEQNFYHLEAQTYKDQDIILRMFDYGYRAAHRNKTSSGRLVFPEPRIIYLSAEEDFPDKYVLEIEFGGQGVFEYQIETFKFYEKTIEEINEKKLVLLIPFQLLKLKKRLKKSRQKEDIDSLKKLIKNDIMGSIETNLAVGNITRDDGVKLVSMVKRLYQHIYLDYEELRKGEVADMFEEVFELEVDKILDELAEVKAQLSKQKEVMSLLLKGKSISEIAEQLSLSAEEIEKMCK